MHRRMCPLEEGHPLARRLGTEDYHCHMAFSDCLLNKMAQTERSYAEPLVRKKEFFITQNNLKNDEQIPELSDSLQNCGGIHATINCHRFLRGRF